MKCMDCNGTGDVKPVGYRDTIPPPPLEKIKTPKVPSRLSKLWAWFGAENNIGKLVSIPVFILATGLIYWQYSQDVIIAQNKAAQQIIETKKDTLLFNMLLMVCLNLAGLDTIRILLV